jgi:hypothetical protein
MNEGLGLFRYISMVQVKLVHTCVFVVLSLCVLYALFSGIFNHITQWTWDAVASVCVEGLVLAVSGGRCPLTIVAERLGATQGAVADIFLPKWFADRILPICGTTFLVACVLLMVRLLRA